MLQVKRKIPILDWNTDNGDANIAFTMVARNERAKQMWSDIHNASRYVPPSFNRNKAEDLSVERTKTVQGFKNDNDKPRPKQSLENDNEEPAPKQSLENDNEEPAPKQSLENDNEEPTPKQSLEKDNEEPTPKQSLEKDNEEPRPDPGDCISGEMLAFTFDENNRLIMNVTADQKTTVRFNKQEAAERDRFTWIFPRGQSLIRVDVAEVLEFDVVLPEYGRNEDSFHHNCDLFRGLVACDDLPVNSLETNEAATKQASSTSKSQNPFYLQGIKLGEGSYGEVYKVLEMPSGKILAGKRFNNSEAFRAEAMMLRKVCETHTNDNIVQFVGESHEESEPMLVMEYVAGGDLRRMIKKGMNFRQIATLANQALSALVFIHGQNVMHRDLKPGNILCVGPYQYKLGDFGVSKVVSALASRQGTDFYMAPEVDSEPSYDCSSDIWSLGVILSECLNGLPKGVPGTIVWMWCAQVLQRWEEHYAVVESMDCDPRSPGLYLARLITEGMLQMDAKDRWSAQECLDKYPFVWEDLDNSEDSDDDEDSGGDEDRDAERGATTPTQGHQNEPPQPSLLKKLKDDMADGQTVLNFPDWHHEDTSDVAEETQSFPNDDNSTIRPAPSIGAGEIDDAAWLDHYASLVKDDKARSRSIADGDSKRQRDSQSSTSSSDEDEDKKEPKRAKLNASI